MTTDTVTELSAIDIVDELEEMVTGARRVPLSPNVIVNEDETLELIDRLRLGLPDELRQARNALDDGARIVATARDEAEQVMRRAEAQAQEMLEHASARAAAMLAEHTLTQQAQAHAAQVVADAEDRAASIRAEADAYARDVMSRLEEQLVRAVTTVRKGIDALPAPAGARRGRRG